MWSDVFKGFVLAVLLLIAYNGSQNGRYRVPDFEAPEAVSRHAVIDSRSGRVYHSIRQEKAALQWSQISPFEESQISLVKDLPLE